MEDIDGGLHPAVGGQSLNEDEDADSSTAARYATKVCSKICNTGQEKTSFESCFQCHFYSCTYSYLLTLLSTNGLLCPNWKLDQLKPSLIRADIYL